MYQDPAVQGTWERVRVELKTTREIGQRIYQCRWWAVPLGATRCVPEGANRGHTIGLQTPNQNPVKRTGACATAWGHDQDMMLREVKSWNGKWKQSLSSSVGLKTRGGRGGGRGEVTADVAIVRASGAVCRAPRGRRLVTSAVSLYSRAKVAVPFLNCHDLILRQSGDLVVGEHSVLAGAVVARRDAIPAEVRSRWVAGLGWSTWTHRKRWGRRRGLADRKQAQAHQRPKHVNVYQAYQNGSLTTKTKLCRRASGRWVALAAGLLSPSLSSCTGDGQRDQTAAAYDVHMLERGCGSNPAGCALCRGLAVVAAGARQAPRLRHSPPLFSPTRCTLCAKP